MIKKINKRKNKKPFGGIVIDFEGREETVESVFGRKPISPAKMTKTIWTFIKRRHLMIKPK